MMPVLAVVQLGPIFRRMIPLPLPLFLLWPFVGLAWLVLRLGFQRTVAVRLSGWPRVVVWSVVALLFAANWVWVIARDG